MTYLIIILLCGINIAPLIFPQLDIWHAQGIWTQVCILILFSSTFLKRPVFIEPQNKELGLLHLWIGLLTAYICFVAQTHHKYDITHFFPYFNFLCLVILYKIIVQYLNVVSIELCLKFIKYAIIANLLISVLQYFGASQFFKLFHPDDKFHNNPINGFIGNGTHLSGFLAMMIPVFLYFGKREDYLCLGLMGVLLCLAGTATDDPSISGFIIGLVVVSLWLFRVKRPKLWVILSLGVFLVGAFLIVKDMRWFKLFTAFSGRNSFWEYYLPIIKQWFVTGCGLGSLNLIHKDSAFPNIRHLHMEYIQIILELGIIGLVLVFAVIRKFFCLKHNTRLELTLKCVFLGFCLSACFNYPMHLWLPAVYACFAYSAFMALKRGERYASID